MLKGLSPLLSPDLLHVLASMGHGDEIVLADANFTAETLGFLLKRHPGVRFVWIMGADNLASFHRWRAWRRIFETVPVAVMDRPGWRLRALSAVAAKAFSKGFVPEARAASLARRRPPAWTFLTLRLSPASSTALRAGKRR